LKNKIKEAFKSSKIQENLTYIYVEDAFMGVFKNSNIKQITHVNMKKQIFFPQLKTVELKIKYYIYFSKNIFNE